MQLFSADAIRSVFDYLCTGRAAQTFKKQKSRITTSPLCRTWYLDWGFKSFIYEN